jgi:hypothetical protein
LTAVQINKYTKEIEGREKHGIKVMATKQT